MTPDAPVTEDELHAFIDGQLPAEREGAVRGYLAASPEEARRIDSYITQRAALRRAMADPPGGVLPPRLLLSQIAAETVRRRRWLGPWPMAAAVLLSLGLGGAGGWYAGRGPTQSRDAHAAAVLVAQAVATYAVFGADDAHPVEFTAAELPGVLPRLSTRLGRTLQIPSLDSIGFHLVGGRIVATEHGAPALLLLYESQPGDRIGLLLRAMAPEIRWSLHREATNGTATDCWIGGGVGYAVVGQAKIAELGSATKLVLKQDATPDDD